MTSSITQAGQHQAIPAAARREWCCGTPITEPHAPGCAYAPSGAVDYAGEAEITPEPAPEPPPTPTQAPAAAHRRSYGFKKAGEFDLELPTGALVRCRKLTKGQLIELNLVDVLDGFTPDLRADIESGDEELGREAFAKAVLDPARNAKIFGPMDRVCAAVVIIPTVVLEGPSTDTQVNVREVELEDKLTIFLAAVGEQLNALKSVLPEPAPGV